MHCARLQAPGSRTLARVSLQNCVEFSSVPDPKTHGRIVPDGRNCGAVIIDRTQRQGQTESVLVPQVEGLVCAHRDLLPCREPNVKVVLAACCLFFVGAKSQEPPTSDPCLARRSWRWTISTTTRAGRPASRKEALQPRSPPKSSSTQQGQTCPLTSLAPGRSPTGPRSSLRRAVDLYT